MSKRIKLHAELWDKMHFLFRDFNDRMIHVSLEYDFLIDIKALKTVIICFFEKVPVLHSSFKFSPINPYWTENDYTIEDILTVIDEPQDPEKVKDEFLMQYLPPDSKLQMKIALINKNGSSTLCFIVNHMCMDGGDLKYFLASFCKGYTKYVENAVSPLDVRSGSRSFEEVYADMSPTDKQAAKRLYKNVSNKDKHKFPFTPDSEDDKSFYVKRKIDAKRFERIRLAGKELGATVNDVIVAAFLHSLYEITDYADDEEIVVSCAIDLRRHISDMSDKGYTNHTAFMPVSSKGKGRDIRETIELAKISAQNSKDDRFLGLYGLPLLKLAYTIMPYAASEEIIKIGYSNPLIAMSNVGVFDPKRLSLCGHEPSDVFLTGAVKYKPYALLTAITYKGVLTLSVCERGNDEDKEIINNLFNHMEKHFNELTGEKQST